jgi:hypothetical protein
MKHTPTPWTLTKAMRRELESYARDGNPSDPADWHGAGALWFHARDRVIGALLRRGLLADVAGDYTVTDAGRTALAKGAA